MKRPPKSLTYRLPAVALEHPMPWLKDRIVDTGLSSLEIERQSGVPGSTIRSVMNGRTGGLKCTVWAQLVLWLLERRRRTRPRA
tara:strand:- start:3581 stop:3832 length:252 start_codon:yes stop_codon:yes gene_type:complete